MDFPIGPIICLIALCCIAWTVYMATFRTDDYIRLMRFRRERRR